MHFASDNVAGVAPRILEALVSASAGTAPSYGADELTAKVEAMLAEVFEREVAVSLVATGTAANALSISAYSPQWGAVLCHAESHVMTDECGAPEAFSGGAKLVGLTGRHGKLTRQGVAEALAQLPAGVQHHVQPAVLSLTQATEAGTVYAVEEIAAFSDLAKSRGLALHMDGARFANALVSLGCSPADMTWRAGVDILSFGATKTGALAAEAIVMFDPTKRQEMLFRRKRMGHLFSKHRFLAAQMAAYLEDGYWLDLARHANAMAARLTAGLGRLGIRVAAPVEANEIFPVLSRPQTARLRAAGAIFYDWDSPAMAGEGRPAEDETVVRLVLSWATDESQVDRFLAVLGQNEAVAARQARA